MKIVEDSPLSSQTSILEQFREKLGGYFKGLRSSKDIIKDKATYIDWLVKDLFMKGGTSVLIAREKTGKSTLARQVGLAIAEGRPLFNRQPKRGLVLYLAFEDHVAGIKDHLQMMGSKGADNFIIHCGDVKGDLVEALSKFCEIFHPDLIVLDTLAKAIKLSDLNDYSKVVKALQPVTDLARHYGTHILYIHHMNKSNDSKDISRAMGSVGITGEVDNIILLEKDRTGMRYLKTVPRYGKPIEDMLLQWDMDQNMYDIHSFSSEK
jgi:RecA-family ATPase